MRYAGLATQMLVALGIAVFIGLKADDWLSTSPLFSCVLPLLTLIATFYKILRDTGRRNSSDKTTHDEE